MKTIFVTGAEGFAGRRLVELFTKQNIEVVGGVRNRGRKLAFEKKHGKALVCDVSDAINVARCIASVKPDGVVHLASISQCSVADDEPLAAYQSIVTAWANVLDGVRRATPRARVLLVSACDVYGSTGSNGQPLSENSPCNPLSTFGSLKATAESISQTFFRNYHLDITIARPFTFTGAGQAESCFLPSLARQIVQWNPATDGTTLRVPDMDDQRDLLHVSDVAEALRHLLFEGKPNETYNIAGGRGHTLREMCQWMAQAAGAQVAFESFASEGGALRSMVGDNAKICRDTAWRPTQNAQSAINDLVSSLRTAPAAALQR